MKEIPIWLEAELARMYTRFRDKALPDYMWEGVRLYVSRGICPGHFLTNALENRLCGAYSHADDHNTAAMQQWVLFFYNDLPSGCWGTPEKVTAWVNSGGLLGLHETSAKEKP